MNSYDEIFSNHKGFATHKWTHYLYIYDLLFSGYREKNKPLTFMEIGVDKGGSLEIWKNYLPDGSIIHGVDINPECNKLNFAENIFFHLGSASDRSFMEKTFADIEFDIILDDGSHRCSDVIETFKIMFPKIKNGGLYIAEDLHTSYWPNFGGGYRKKGSSIEYFKDLVEAINSDHINSERSSRSFGFLSKFAKYFSRNFRDKVKHILRKKAGGKSIKGDDYSKTIESIIFYDSICAIKKFSGPKNNPFKPVLTGDENVGYVNCYKNELEVIQNVKEIFGR